MHNKRYKKSVWQEMQKLNTRLPGIHA